MSAPIPFEVEVSTSSWDIARTEKLLVVHASDYAALETQNRQLREQLTAACHALRSYQYGNIATDLAEEAADAIDAALAATDKEKA